MNIIATPKSKFEKAVKKCAVSPLKSLTDVIFFYVCVLMSTLERYKSQVNWSGN